jgi:hypothetical protein
MYKYGSEENMVSKMPHDSTQRNDAKWAAHLLTCRLNLYIARLGQLHPHPAQRVVNEDHVRSLEETMEESAVLKFQHPLEVVLDHDDALLDLPPLSHLPATATASILRGQHRRLAYTLFLRKQIFAASSGMYASPLDVPDRVTYNHPDATWPCVVYSHGGILRLGGGPSPHTDVLSCLGLLRDEFELDLAAFIHDDNQKLLSLDATITDTWRINSRKPLMTAIQDLYAGEHKAMAYCMWHPKLKTILDTFMASPVMCDWITRNTFTMLSTGGTQGVSLVEALCAVFHLAHCCCGSVIDLGRHLRRMRPVSTPLATPTRTNHPRRLVRFTLHPEQVPPGCQQHLVGVP